MIDRQTADTKFSVIEAALHFFVVAAKNPLGFAWLTLWSLILLLVGGGLSLAFILPMSNASAGGQLDEFAPLFLWFPVYFVAVILGMLSLCGAWARFLIFGVDKPGLPLRLGGDEGRIVVVSIVASIVMTAVQFAVMLVVMIPMTIVAAIATGSGGENSMESITWIMPLLMAGAILALNVYFTVRLYPAFAISILDRQLIIFDAWEATRGVFWPATAAVILSSVAAFVIYLGLLGMAFLTPVIAWVESEPPQIASPADVASWVGPSVFVAMTLFSIIFVWLCAIPFGPLAYIAERHKRIQDTPGDGNG